MDCYNQDFSDRVIKVKRRGIVYEFNPDDIVQMLGGVILATRVGINDLRKSMNILRVDLFDNKPALRELERNMKILERMSKGLNNLTDVVKTKKMK